MSLLLQNYCYRKETNGKSRRGIPPLLRWEAGISLGAEPGLIKQQCIITLVIFIYMKLLFFREPIYFS